MITSLGAIATSGAPGLSPPSLYGRYATDRPYKSRPYRPIRPLGIDLVSAMSHLFDSANAQIILELLSLISAIFLKILINERPSVTKSVYYFTFSCFSVR